MEFNTTLKIRIIRITRAIKINRLRFYYRYIQNKSYSISVDTEDQLKEACAFASKIEKGLNSIQFKNTNVSFKVPPD